MRFLSYRRVMLKHNRHCFVRVDSRELNVGIILNSQMAIVAFHRNACREDIYEGLEWNRSSR